MTKDIWLENKLLMLISIGEMQIKNHEMIPFSIKVTKIKRLAMLSVNEYGKDPNPHILLLAMWNGTATLKIVCKFLKKLNICLPFGPAIRLSAFTHRKREQYSYNDLYMNLQSSLICRSQKPEKTQMSNNKWMDKLCYILTTQYYSAIKRIRYLIHITMWINLNIIMQSERNQTKMYTFCESIDIKF